MMKLQSSLWIDHGQPWLINMAVCCAIACMFVDVDCALQLDDSPCMGTIDFSPCSRHLLLWTHKSGNCLYVLSTGLETVLRSHDDPQWQQLISHDTFTTAWGPGSTLIGWPRFYDDDDDDDDDDDG